MTADENDKNLAPRERRWKWYSHPLPLIVLLCFEMVVGFCIWEDVRTGAYDEYNMNTCRWLLSLHPLCVLVLAAVNGSWRDWSWWSDDAGVRGLVIVFGGLQWYAMTWAGIAIYRRWRRRMRPLGHCSVCWYDLYGNTSGICPECGTPIPDEIGHEIMEELSDANADL